MEKGDQLEYRASWALLVFLVLRARPVYLVSRASGGNPASRE